MDKLKKAGREKQRKKKGFFFSPFLPLSILLAVHSFRGPTCKRPAQRNQTTSDRNPGGFIQPPSYCNFSRGYSAVSGIWCEHCSRSYHYILLWERHARRLVAVPIPDSAKIGIIRTEPSRPRQTKSNQTSRPTNQQTRTTALLWHPDPNLPTGHKSRWNRRKRNLDGGDADRVPLATNSGRSSRTKQKQGQQQKTNEQEIKPTVRGSSPNSSSSLVTGSDT